MSARRHAANGTDRLLPTAVEVCEVRWIEPGWVRDDIQVRRFRRPPHAVAFVARLRARGVTEVGAFVTDLGPWFRLIDGGGTRP